MQHIVDAQDAKMNMILTSSNILYNGIGKDRPLYKHTSDSQVFEDFHMRIYVV